MFEKKNQFSITGRVGSSKRIRSRILKILSALKMHASYKFMMINRDEPVVNTN